MQVCKSPEDEESLLICDWCQQGVHMACHVPAVTVLPEDEDEPWFCSACADTVRRRDAAVALLREHRAACGVAGVTPEAVAVADVSPEEEVEVLAQLLSGSSPDVEMADAAAAAAVAGEDADDSGVILVSDSMDPPAVDGAAGAGMCEAPADAIATAKAESAEGGEAAEKQVWQMP